MMSRYRQSTLSDVEQYSTRQYFLQCKMWFSIFFYSGCWLCLNDKTTFQLLTPMHCIEAATCWDLWMPGADTYETPWLDAPHHPTHSCLSILIFRLHAHLYIEIWLMPSSSPLPFFCLHAIVLMSRLPEPRKWLECVKQAGADTFLLVEYQSTIPRMIVLQRSPSSLQAQRPGDGARLVVGLHICGEPNYGVTRSRFSTAHMARLHPDW